MGRAGCVFNERTEARKATAQQSFYIISRTFSSSPRSHVLGIHSVALLRYRPWDWWPGASPQRTREMPAPLGCGGGPRTPSIACQPSFRGRV